MMSSNSHKRKKSTLKAAMSPASKLNSSAAWGPPPPPGSYPSSAGKCATTPGSAGKGRYASQSDIRSVVSKKPTKLSPDQIIDIVSKLQNGEFDRLRGVEQFLDAPKNKYKKNLYSSFASCSSGSANNTSCSSRHNNSVKSSVGNSMLSSTMNSGFSASTSSKGNTNNNNLQDSRITKAVPFEETMLNLHEDLEKNMNVTVPKHIKVAEHIVKRMDEYDQLMSEKAAIFVANKIEEGVPSTEISRLI